jgi:hypothetical protein
MAIPPEMADQIEHPQVQVLRDIMVSAAWNLGKVFAAYFAADAAETEGG